MVIVNGNPSGRRHIDDILRPLSYHFANRSHVVSFMDITTPDPIQPESYNVSLETTSTCCQDLHAPHTHTYSEPLWDVMDCRVPQYPHSLANQKLIQFFQREIRRIPLSRIRRLISLMRGRGFACIGVRGDCTRY